MFIHSNRTSIFLIISIYFLRGFTLINGTETFDIDDFVHNSKKHAEASSRDTYLNHPCRRECIKDSPAKVCNYTFSVSNGNSQKNAFFHVFFKNLCF